MSLPLRAIVADDEPLARARLRRLLGQFDGLEVVAECASGEAAVDALHRLGPDIAFLDIQMPDLDGFDVLETLPRQRRPHVVFVTAFSEHAVRAFDARAVDYLLKPVSAERLRQAIERIRFAAAPVAAAGAASQDAPAARAPAPAIDAVPCYAARIAVPCGTRIHLVPVEDIDHVQAQANYIELHIGAKSLVLRETLGNFSSRLDPVRFLRVHRSRIVRLDGVLEAEPNPSGRYALRLRCGARLVTGRSYAAAVRAALGL
jgi:two-component system LytT family response regulator